MAIKARYENGVFRPLSDVPVKEGTIAEVYLPEEKQGEKRPWKSVKDSPDIVTGIERIRRRRST